MGDTPVRSWRRLRFFSLFFVFVLLSGMIAACGGDDPVPTPTVSVDPTPTEAAAANPPSTVVAVAATADEPTPTPTASGPVVVDALWFAQDGNNVLGGTSSVKVTVAKKENRELRVGFYESEVSGTGAQWRSSGWMAVITSALLLGIDPSTHEFTFDVAGRIDGPSAGALMTIAVLAGYLGDEVRDDAAMTGTINPDGTIGPVGGIPHKIQGAAENGKKLVLVPGGQRYDFDYAEQRSVDVVEVGRVNGIEVQLVSDIYDAYELLTGNELPSLDGTGPRAAYPPRAFDKMRAGTISWVAKYQTDRGRFTSLPADIQDYRVDSILIADDLAAKADKALGEGQIAVAYQNAVWAATEARSAAQAAELDNLYFNQGLDPLIERLDGASSAEIRMNGVLERLKAERAVTASDTIVMMDAYSNLAVAQGLVAEAQAAIDDLLLTPDFTEDDALTAIYLAAYQYAYADIFLDIVEDSLNTGFGFGKAAAPDTELLTAMSETLRRGAEANIAYFESLIIDPWARDYGVHPDLAKYYFMQYDGDYQNAVAASAGGAALAAGMIEPGQVASLTLGSSLTAYSSSATVLAKYYSLGAELDEYATVTGYERSAALADMLDLADRRADEIMRAVATEEPISALYYYENARIFRQGGPDDQMNALNYYWQSAILAQLLGIFSGDLYQ